jgi:hypothetical protein
MLYVPEFSGLIVMFIRSGNGIKKARQYRRALNLEKIPA